MHVPAGCCGCTYVHAPALFLCFPHCVFRQMPEHGSSQANICQNGNGSHIVLYMNLWSSCFLKNLLKRIYFKGKGKAISWNQEQVASLGERQKWAFLQNICQTKSAWIHWTWFKHSEVSFPLHVANTLDTLEPYSPECILCSQHVACYVIWVLCNDIE